MPCKAMALTQVSWKWPENGYHDPNKVVHGFFLSSFIFYFIFNFIFIEFYSEIKQKKMDLKLFIFDKMEPCFTKANQKWSFFTIWVHPCHWNNLFTAQVIYSHIHCWAKNLVARGLDVTEIFYLQLKLFILMYIIVCRRPSR